MLRRARYDNDVAKTDNWFYSQALGWTNDDAWSIDDLAGAAGTANPMLTQENGADAAASSFLSSSSMSVTTSTSQPSSSCKSPTKPRAEMMTDAKAGPCTYSGASPGSIEGVQFQRDLISTSSNLQSSSFRQQSNVGCAASRSNLISPLTPRKCMKPGCEKPRAVGNNGHVYGYCSAECHDEDRPELAPRNDRRTRESPRKQLEFLPGSSVESSPRKLHAIVEDEVIRSERSKRRSPWNFLKRCTVGR